MCSAFSWDVFWLLLVGVVAGLLVSAGKHLWISTLMHKPRRHFDENPSSPECAQAFFWRDCDSCLSWQARGMLRKQGCLLWHGFCLCQLAAV